MNKAYYDILKIALSGENDIARRELLRKQWSNVEEEILFEIAATDEVSSHIGFLLQGSGLTYSRKWKDAYNSVDQRISTLMTQLETVAQALAKSSIQIVALKNAGITKGIYPNNGCSPMGDIDLLVRTEDFRKAHEIIENELGYTFKFRSEFEVEELEEAFRGGGTEYYKDVEGVRVWLELQWRPIAGRWIQPHNEPNGNVLMGRSMKLDGSAVRILNPEDNLLQVALHTAKHSYVRSPGFRLHSDVDRIVRFQNINWEAFVQLVLNLKLRTAVYFSLYYAKELLHTPIPGEVLEKLKPAWFRGKVVGFFIQRAGIFNQKKSKFSRMGYILFNLALYDNVKENMKAIFPPFDSLKIKYPINSKYELPYYYLIRIKDLLFKRAKL